MHLANSQESKSLGEVKILQEAPIPGASSLSDCLDDLKLGWKKSKSLAGLWHDWPKLVGERLAPNCRPISMHRGVLVIGASHPQWRQALQYNKMQLLATLQTAGHRIKDLRIQQYHPSKTERIESEKNIWERHPSRIDVHGLATCQKCGKPAPTGEISLWGQCGFCHRQELSPQISKVTTTKDSSQASPKSKF